LLPYLCGAGGGTRTHTPSLTTDFESVSSTNSNTPAKERIHYSAEVHKKQEEQQENFLPFTTCMEMWYDKKE
jgi:hypothetical protein